MLWSDENITCACSILLFLRVFNWHCSRSSVDLAGQNFQSRCMYVNFLFFTLSLAISLQVATDAYHVREFLEAVVISWAVVPRWDCSAWEQVCASSTLLCPKSSSTCPGWGNDRAERSRRWSLRACEWLRRWARRWGGRIFRLLHSGTQKQQRCRSACPVGCLRLRKQWNPRFCLPIGLLWLQVRSLTYSLLSASCDSLLHSIIFLSQF